MPNNYHTLTDLFVDIANVIRFKNNTVEEIAAEDFPALISDIKSYVKYQYNNDKVTKITPYMFYNNQDITSVDCPNVTTIGDNAFANCANLERVFVSDRVTYVGADAFKGCHCTIYLDCEPDGFDDHWNPDNCEVMLLTKTYDISKTSEDSVIAKIYANTAGEHHLYVCGTGRAKPIQYNMNSSDAQAWYDIRRLITTVVIAAGVTDIGDDFMFAGFANLASVYIHGPISDIGRAAFDSCVTLTDFNIPDSVTRLCSDAFYDCTNLVSITIPVSVTRIDSLVFKNCTSLIVINYKGAVTQWRSINTEATWDDNTGSYTICCTDGTIAKNGSVSYY